MNKPDLKEVAIKEKRLLDFLDLHGFDAAVIGRSDNFAWITGGGDSRVVLSSETGFSYLVISRERKTLVALVADSSKVLIEELEGSDIVRMCSSGSKRRENPGCWNWWKGCG